MKSSQAEDLILDFKGPFKFTEGDNCLFESEFVSEEGIYLWTIHVPNAGKYYVYYIGETTAFGKRHREHFTHIVGLNYEILDAKSASEGTVNKIWQGMWRDRSPGAVPDVIRLYSSLKTEVLDYLDIIEVFFAPTSLEKGIRKHLEGSIGYNLRYNHPDLKLFYPDDNHIGTKKEPLNRTLRIHLPTPIEGIDTRIKV